MTLAKKTDSHQGGVKTFRKVCQLIERSYVHRGM